jgi:flagellar biosynthetic protein FliP
VASYFGALAALALVLVLFGCAMRLLRRFASGVAGGRARLPLEVVQRVALGQKQGIAIVRIGERVVAVSMGEGGVRPLLELGDADRDAVLAAPPAMPLALPGLITTPRDFRALLRTATRSAALILVMFAVPLGSVGSVSAPTAVVAQAPRQPAAVRPAPEAQAPAPAAGSAAARADTMLTRLAPQIDLRVGNQREGGLRLSGTVGVVVMMGLLTLLPTLLLMMTSFTRILIVLHFLRQALGTQSAPPAHLMAGLAMLLTGFVMAPTLSEVNNTALQPWMNGQMEQAEMLAVGAQPFREFMLSQTRERDIATFVEMSAADAPDWVENVPLIVLISAFVTSELRTAFQIGFALFLPFIIIDLVVASVLMSMGMFMLPPAMIALPFKLLLFVLVDGWSLVVQGLVASFR